jgi:hypothetical protein
VLSPYRVSVGTHADEGLGALRSTSGAPFPFSDLAIATFVAVVVGAGFGFASYGLLAAVLSLLAFLAFVASNHASLVAPHTDLHDRALVVRRLFVPATTVLFDQIEAVHYEYSDADAWSATSVVVTGGASVSLGASGNGTVTRALDVACARRFLARAKKELARGERVWFGRLVLTTEGLYTDDLHLPWSFIREVELRGTKLAVSYGARSYERTLTMELSSIPNARVLVALLATATVVTAS